LSIGTRARRLYQKPALFTPNQAIDGIGNLGVKPSFPRLSTAELVERE
jgi:hypothetical protein